MDPITGMKFNKTKLSRRQAFKFGLKASALGVFACIAATPAKAGYGACSQCSCNGFVADYRNNNVCSNCGHSYGDHW